MISSRTLNGKGQRLQQQLGSTYTIIEHIGGGGMGDVFLATHKTLGGKWAIKVLSDELSRDPVVVDRFLEEARIEARLQHPNIIKVVAIGQQGDFHFFVMTYVEGEDLDQRLKRIGRMDAEQTATMGISITRALECAHGNAIIHRDLKPSNIRIDHYGTVVVMDFGIARVRDMATTQGKTVSGTAIGTPLYMSPEQTVGGKIDARSDLYSLGVILYETIAGENPFAADSDYAVGIRHLTLQPKPLLEVRDDIPPAISDIVARLLEKKPEDRYQSAVEVRMALVPLGGNVEIRTPMPRTQTGHIPTGIASIKNRSIPGLLNLGPRDAILHKIPESEANRNMTEQEMQVAELIDGVRTTEQVLNESALSAESGVGAISSLLRDGFIYSEIPMVPYDQGSESYTPPPLLEEQTRPNFSHDSSAKDRPDVKPPGTNIWRKFWTTLLVSASCLAIGFFVWAFWPEPAPQRIKVDASPFASVTIRTQDNEILHIEDTPFSISLRRGKYTFEFVSGNQSRREPVIVSSEPPAPVRVDFWSKNQTRELLQMYQQRGVGNE